MIFPGRGLPSGELALDDTTFDEQARAHPSLRSLYELRATLGRLRLADLPVGADQRARCLLSAFQAVTGRNQPSSSRFVFGPARWMRGLVREQAGRAVASVAPGYGTPRGSKARLAGNSSERAKFG